MTFGAAASMAGDRSSAVVGEEIAAEFQPPARGLQRDQRIGIRGDIGLTIVCEGRERGGARRRSVAVAMIARVFFRQPSS
jgi:hypothetical protein